MMWSGDPQYSQWALNPSTYQNVAHEEVDWAALAQQWIQMKETHPSDQIPPAPPPPAIGEKSDSGDKKKDSELEGGEAPMDMDTKEDNSNSSNTQSGDANTWNTWPNWQQWGWNWSATGGMVPPGGVPPPNQTLVQGKGTTSTSAMTVPPYSYPHNSQAYTSGTGVYDYNHAGGSDQYSQYKDVRGMDHSQHVGRSSEVMASGYWTSGGPADTGGVPPGPGPSPFIRHNRHDWRRNNRSHDRLRTSEKSDDEEDTTTVLDAAKRRQLPAWIREGLEKMEREKQKKIDRERQIKEREAYLQKKREDEEHAMNELEKNAGQPMIPKKSKFESDSEESGRGDSPTPSQSSLKRKSRFRNADSPNSSPRHPAARFPSTEPEPVKSREEQMQEVINTHPRLTIGVPPVRGSKATAPNRSSSSTNRFGRSSYRGNVPSSRSTRYASGPTSAAPEYIYKQRNSTLSHFRKTTSNSFKTRTTGEKQTPDLEFLNVPVHMLDQRYPSVPTERNRNHRGHSRNSFRPPPKYRVQEKPDKQVSRQVKGYFNQLTGVFAEATLKIPRNELCIVKEILPSEEVSVEATVTIPKSNLNSSAGHVPSEVTTEATVIVPRNNLRTSKNLVASDVSVEATVAVPSQVADVGTTETVISKLVEGMTLTKRQPAVVNATSSVRPPVVIMDQRGQDSSERLSGLTFGFEVNEQLLLSDSDENLFSTNSSELQSVVEESITDLKSVSENLTTKESIFISPVITNDASENFSSRFRVPIAERSELHDTIVAYVSGSWGAVVKEMQRGESVRYYSGQ